MKVTMLVALSMILAGTSTLSAHADLSSEIQRAQAGDFTIEQSFQKTLCESHLVFVVPTGALAALTESFQTQLRYLTSIRNGCQPNFTEVKVPFLGAWRENADALAARLETISAATKGRRLIVLGNPATGADSLLALLRHPELARAGLVSRLIVIQGTMLGVPAIDQAEAEGLPVGGTSKWLTRNAHSAFYQAIASLSGADRSAIEDTTFFIRSEKDPGKLAFLLRGSAKAAAESGDGRTDGITPVSWQWIPGLGKDLGVISGVDHWGLTASGPIATTVPNYRVAFLKAVLAMP